MSPSLVGRVCLVTGATKGIGKGIAVQLGAAGAKVYITGRTKDMLEDCAAEIRARGGTPIPIQVGDSYMIQKFFLFQYLNNCTQNVFKNTISLHNNDLWSLT
jgi:NADP-dependent 3-hydroxy acid dehydrogenase YdfG